MEPGATPPTRLMSPNGTPLWMKTYPRLMDQMRDIIEEWKEEREQLLINAEQTHAYCQSLAFQVKSMQEENGRLQTENSELKSRQEMLERELAQVRTQLDDRGRTPSNLEEEVVGLRMQLSQTLSQKMLLEQENNDLINALAVDPPQKPAARSAAYDDEYSGEYSFDSPPLRQNGSSKGKDSLSKPTAAHGGVHVSGVGTEDGAGASRHLSTLGMKDLATGVQESGEDRSARRYLGRSPTQAMHASPASWTEPAIWISSKYPQPVHGVAMSACGSTAGDTAVVSWDGSCSLLRASAQDGAIQYSQNFYLDPSDGSTLYKFRGHSGEVNTLHFQPRAAAGAGELLAASGSDDTSCLVWAPATGKSDCIARLTGHSQAVYGVKFHPLDCALLATVAFDRLGKVWDLRSAQCVMEVEGHRDDIIGLDFAPAGTHLATGSDDCTCRVWDLRKLGAKGGGMSHLHCLEHKDEVKRVEWSPCGTMLATASSNGHVNIWQSTSQGWLNEADSEEEQDPLTLKRALTGHEDIVFDLAWVPHGCTPHHLGARLVSVSHDHTLRVWGLPVAQGGRAGGGGGGRGGSQGPI